jgi:hypothetical protein
MLSSMFSKQVIGRCCSINTAAATAAVGGSGAFGRRQILTVAANQTVRNNNDNYNNKHNNKQQQRLMSSAVKFDLKGSFLVSKENNPFNLEINSSKQICSNLFHKIFLFLVSNCVFM